MRHPWRALSISAAATALVLVSAGTAGAEPVSDTEASVLLQPADLHFDYGRIVSDESNSPGPGGGLASTCEPLSEGRPQVVGRNAQRLILNDIVYSAGATWSSMVFIYPSAQEANASYRQLRDRTLLRCRGKITDSVGDDDLFVPAVQANTAHRLPLLDAAKPRFVNAASTILLAPKDAPRGYHSDFSFMVTTLDANAVIQVRVFASTPLNARVRADALRASSAVAQRYATAPWK